MRDGLGERTEGTAAEPSEGGALGREVRIPLGDGREFPAHAAVPAGARRGVVVLHEIFGPQPEIRRVVERFARAGYAAAAPDLFSMGLRLTCLVRAMQATRRGEGPILAQIAAARAWLVRTAGVSEEAVGVIGFCLGGGLALAAGRGFGAVSTNYGMIPPARVLEGIAPTIGCFGEKDKKMGPKSARTLRALLEGQGTPHEIHEFPGVGHSFLTDGHHPLATRFAFGMGIVPYTPETAEEGWRRILAFFDQHLA